MTQLVHRGKGRALFRLILSGWLLGPLVAEAVCPEFSYPVSLDNGTAFGYVGFESAFGPPAPDWTAGGLGEAGWNTKAAGSIGGTTGSPPKVCARPSSRVYVQAVHEGPADTCLVEFALDWVESNFRNTFSSSVLAVVGVQSGGSMVSSETLRLDPLSSIYFRTAEFQVEVSTSAPVSEIFALDAEANLSMGPAAIPNIYTARVAVDVSRPRQIGGMECGRVEISDRHLSPFPPVRAAGGAVIPIEASNGFSTEPAVGGRIRGSVRSSASLLPVIYGAVELLDETGALVESLDIPTGDFEFDSIMPGTYYVRTVETEFIDQEAGGVECDSVQCVLDFGTPIVVTDGSDDTVSFVLDGAGPLFRSSFEEFDFVNWHENHIASP